MQKIRYEVDPYNRLVIDKPGTKSGGLPRFRKILDGRFKTDEDNNLTYLVKAPLSESEDTPNQIRLKGSWSLTDDHDLRLTLDREYRETFGDKITLQGEILDVDKNSILFAVTTKRSGNKESTYLLDLDGSWKADEFNRLSFHIRKEEGNYDILTFKAAWEIDNNHQIVYQYEKKRLIKKKSRIHTLLFKGRWDIREAFSISYLLSGSTDSSFEFRTAAGIFKEDRIQYELGIGLAAAKSPAMKSITLSGKWNLKKDIGLVFEIGYQGKRSDAIIFGADARLTGKDTILLRLKSGTGNKDIGASLELSREILKGRGEAFLHALLERGETAIYAGAAWRW